MSIDKILRDKIQALIPINCIPCKVTKVDAVNFTCNAVPLDNDAEIFKIRLKPTIDNEKSEVIAIPSVDSYIIVGFLQNKDAAPYMIKASKIDAYYINGDSFGGLVKVEELVNKINGLENIVNQILTILKATVIPLAPSGTYPFASLYASISAIAPITTVTELENPKVKHG